MTLVLTAGQCHEATVFEVLMEHGEVKRRERGHHDHGPMRNSADVSQDNEGEHNEGLIHLAPEGLLPANQTLV